MMLWDWLGTILALYVALLLRYELFLQQYSRQYQFDPTRIISPVTSWPVDFLDPRVFIVITITWPFFLIIFAVYDGQKSFNRRTEIINLFQAIFTSSLVLAGLLFFAFRNTSRVLIGMFFVLDVIILVSSRLALYFYRSFWKNNRRSIHKKVAIIGAGEIGVRVSRELTKYNNNEAELVGFIDDNPDLLGKRIADLPVLGAINDIDQILEAQPFQHAIIALPLRAHERLVEVAKKLQSVGVNVNIIPDLFSLSFPNASLDGFGGIPVIHLGLPGLHGKKRIIKRVFDVIFSLSCLVLLSPILFIIAIFVKLDSPGPVLFKQKRIGESSQPFELLKFRSMSTNADESTHREYMARLIQDASDPSRIAEVNGSLKQVHDPRVTRIGKFIRKFSLDELPQLINVIRGDMSLVGPRPPIPYEVEMYDDWHMRRFEILPGITGLWQVKARNQVSFDEMVRLDIEYIDNYSFWLDIKLILQTPWAMINGKGAG